jgi:nucleotide-binding universal stress UspA family protein
MTLDTTDYRRILVATDFSAHSNAALKQAVWLARQTKASVTLAHTLPDLRRVIQSTSTRALRDMFYGDGDTFQREIRRASDQRLRKMISDLAASELNISFETLLGEPFVELTHAVQAEGYDLVLAGTRGLAAWEQFFVGSTAKRLIRKCPASVWIVKAEHVGPPKVVLAATDFSDVSLKAVAHGLWVARQADARFHVLHVADSIDVLENLTTAIPHRTSLQREINEEARARLGAVMDLLQADRNRVEIHVSWGTPWSDINQLAQRVAADLVAMGTVGRSGIKGMLLGNTAEKVLATSDCSILTVKPDDFISPIQPAFWPLHPEN